MFIKLLKTAVLIFAILCVVFSLNACDRLKAEVGFKWGQLQMSDPYRAVKKTQKPIGPSMAFDQNIPTVTGSSAGFSGPFESPV